MKKAVAGATAQELGGPSRAVQEHVASKIRF